MSYEQYSPTGFRVLPPVVKNLLIINVLLFLATIFLQNTRNIDLVEILGLHYFSSQQFHPYQFITYMFMHGSVSHIFFNMFALWMFGSALENYWGGKRFIVYYFITGIGAALVHYVIYYFQINPVVSAMNGFIASPGFESLNSFVSSHKFIVNEYSGEIWSQFKTFENNYGILIQDHNNVQALQGCVNFISEYKEHFLNQPVVVGASGAIYGLLLAFGMIFPNSMIYIYFLFPMKAKWFVIFYGVLELIFGLRQTGDNIAHFAHLGGMIFGVLLILLWRYTDRKRHNQYWQ
ncbi:MAG TPA: rhomboid family intramembrane serine protease [Bacteroidales bacterium]|nr:rhomboid family intramembrane serine protease [Bacteroidales bacterium]